ncbi:MAG: hypothetical protein NWF03_03870 [Candidatus Bathyarchaeota archaeon]|nr:hypothetical protein [Candidatus Bathyarchaeota archaeon]
MSKSFNVPQQVAGRKLIVYKSRVDIKTVKATAENMKTQLFRKFIFMKPKPEEIHVVSIDKYFEPYVFVDGEYSIDYSKKWLHNIQVEETMQELTICGERIAPKSLTDSLDISCKIVQLTGTGRYKFVRKANIIFDKEWNEVGIQKLPFLAFEEQPEDILNQIEPQFKNDELTSEKDLELLKSKLVQRPPDILTIHNECFKVTERAVIYKPMFDVTVENTASKKRVHLLIDAITGNTASVKQTKMPKTKEAKEPKKPSTTKDAKKQDSVDATQTEQKPEPKMPQKQTAPVAKRL